MNAQPLTITGPAALVEALPYLDGITPDQITDMAYTLRDKADVTAKIALTYGSTADPEPSPSQSPPRAGTGR